ncbi:alpha amylase catalytic region [Gloeothece citriformis PCC 7424]|uniref:Alpha amylase catalytic region n=1 Tax=Gloeothece citriformis (strain PCC 7424) TaxID=65393 RepID=B7K9Q0_GLOC7|nr:alpha-amylase family protein [Gloeothece citriformis]ACK70018.1 alpha amylase catalytic region [Gloeothece citriformis PCC 7424]
MKYVKNLWYKNAIIYSLDVETFKDSNGDGIGDFPGLTSSLTYLSGLGIDCLWLLPFYPSPNCDDGYDITDYYSVDPRLGSLGDFVEFMHRARELGIRVIIDLVVNHTSIQHPWFQEARSDKNSNYRPYYVWSENPSESHPDLIAFPTVEDSVWEYDEKAEAYYLHHFYKHQPDLNIGNPAVREEILKIMGFWLELGIAGFRIDAAPFLIQGTGLENVTPEKLQGFLQEMREFMLSRRTDAILLAEANVEPEKIPLYFGKGERMHLLFNFILNQYMFLALARQDKTVLEEGLKLLPEIPSTCQWLNFVRHHDELTLDFLSGSQQEEIFAAFAPEENMQIFGRGVRRRLAPMMNNDRRRIELIYSLLFTLPGTPLLRYGAEIGMGDDLCLHGRTSVRTAMQWTDEFNGGFSTANPDELTRPIISDDEYGYKKVNVAFQERDPSSLLNWFEHLIRTRQQCPEFGRGTWEILETGKSCTFAHCCHWEGATVLAIHNFSDRPCHVNIPLCKGKHLWDLFGDHQYEPSDHSGELCVNGYGYRWFRVDER